jgi:nitrogen fixation NifU-like protein
MSDLRDLYQTMILDHYKRPRNFGKPTGADHNAVGNNPICGDRVTVHVSVQEGVVKEVGFEGEGCAISTASASLMTESVKGKRQEEVAEIFERFHELVTGTVDAEQAVADIGKLAVFAGVREFPMRVKCATLAWHTLRAALEERAEPVTTE